MYDKIKRKMTCSVSQPSQKMAQSVQYIGIQAGILNLIVGRK